jgi:hypothetical protein
MLIVLKHVIVDNGILLLGYVKKYLQIRTQLEIDLNVINDIQEILHELNVLLVKQVQANINELVILMILMGLRLSHLTLPTPLLIYDLIMLLIKLEII